MKKLLLLITGIIYFSQAEAQNIAPIAVNDTVYININDSLTNIQPKVNDSDPNGHNIFVESGYYNGLGYFLDSLVYTPTPAWTIWKSYYKAPLNFTGIDSLQYILRDNGNPIMYDTAFIYIYVKNQENQYIDLNNINANINIHSLFHKDNASSPGFEVPKGSGSHTIFAANLWVAGKNQGSTHMNSETFGPNISIYNSLTEFSSNSGPIMDPIHYKKETFDFEWDRLWKISNIEIQHHINNWNNSGYQPIEVIKNWPAHGDVNKGQATNLAPFVDNNNDGVYNPMDGDYPKIKGQQAIYHIYNDMRLDKANSTPMKTEVHYMVYAYNCPSDSAIYNTLFLDYTIYNRSNLTYDSTYVGMWTDIDLGDHTDDFVGCDVERSAYYGYNGDSIDADNPASNIIGYGAHVPAQGIVFLQGAKQDDDGIDNNIGIAPFETINGFGFGDGITDNEYWGMEQFTYYNMGNSSQGDPNIGNEYYNYLKGNWKDGSSKVYGGNGHTSTGGTVNAKYMFPRTSDPLSYGTGGIPQTSWAEFNAAPGGLSNNAGDRRGLGSTGPFTFEPDSSISITMAFVFGRDYQTPGNLAGIVVMQERIDSIRSYFLTDFTSVCNGTLSVNKNTSNSDLLIYPNPFNNQFTINYALENSSAVLEVFSVVGKKVQAQTIQQRSTVVDLSNQPNGFYFVTITDGDNKISQKIIKQ